MFIIDIIDNDLVIESDRIITIDVFKLIIAIGILTVEVICISFYSFSKALFKLISVGCVVFC